MINHRVVNVNLGDQGVSLRVRPVQPGDRTAIFPSVGEYPIYDTTIYTAFQHSTERNRRYRAAIRQLAGGRIVLDIGTGRDALWAVEAVRAGAAHVYAVEQLPEVVEQARTRVARLGMTDTITVLSGDSMEVSLPRPAELCVSEIIGNIAGAEGAAVVIGDALRRLCVPAAPSVPDRCVTMLAAIGLAPGSAEDVLAVAEETVPYVERTLEVAGHPFDIRLCLAGDVGPMVISTPAEVESIRFAGRIPTGQVSRHAITVTRDSLLHGFVLWVRVHCAPDDHPLDALTTGQPSWAPVLAPLSIPGIPVRAGDRIDLSFTSALSDDLVHPDYRLTGTVYRQHDDVPFAWLSPHHGTVFRQSPPYRLLFPEPSSHQ